MLKYEIFMAVSVKVAVLWGVALCSLVDTNDKCFRGAYYLHHQGHVDIKLLRNISEYQSKYTVVHPRRLASLYYNLPSTV